MHKSGGIAICIVSVSSLIQALSSLLLLHVLFVCCPCGATYFTMFYLCNQCLITVFKFHFDFTLYQGQ